jgi:hypothetical protein
MEEQREVLRYSDYCVLKSALGDWMISRRMAEFVETELDRWPRRRWISFVDVTGARVRMRAELIRGLRQSSMEIRSEWRRFKFERRQEAPDEPSDWEIDW